MTPHTIRKLKPMNNPRIPPTSATNVREKGRLPVQSELALLDPGQASKLQMKYFPFRLSMDFDIPEHMNFI